MATGVCEHIVAMLADEHVKEPILKKYSSLVAWNAYRCRDVTQPPAKRRKTSYPTCDACNALLLRPFVCLHCQYSACWKAGHASVHLKEKAHQFGIDIKSGRIFCSECDDFIYNLAIENEYLSTLVSIEEKQTRFQVAKKGREPFKPWAPSEKEASALEGSVLIPCQGRRGLLNLGQTCFLNAVLQCFIHNPLLRNFFLSDRHNWRLCKLKDCMSCEMDKLFFEVYSENTSPYGPTSFLVTTWRVSSSELSGYAQHDAHEFFISVLNQIHSTSRGSTNVSCNCIIHSTFAGSLQSDVKCERCGNVTTTIDPILDISLELKGKGGEMVTADNTLAGCLRRFTQPEKLGSKEYSCSKCGKASHEAIKRLSIRKLPPVLSFQFKRFEHKTSDKSQARKIDAPIRFPATLNMAPYTTLVMNMREKDDAGMSTGPLAMYDYDLFAVINHEGQINNGHYTNFARFQDEWFRFDDDKVTQSDLGTVLNSAAYMCFYIKRHLDYQHMTPSYVLTRETEAVKEKEIEREKEAARIKEVEDALLATV